MIFPGDCVSLSLPCRLSIFVSISHLFVCSFCSPQNFLLSVLSICQFVCISPSLSPSLTLLRRCSVSSCRSVSPSQPHCRNSETDIRSTKKENDKDKKTQTDENRHSKRARSQTESKAGDAGGIQGPNPLTGGPSKKGKKFAAKFAGLRTEP